MPIWQVSAGNYGRYYHDVFLEFGVALIGPGNPGEWALELPDEEFGGSYVRRFADEMQHGDVLVLRQGRAMIQAVGRVTGDYIYLDQFDDVNGWDLQHGRRVRWHELQHKFDQDVFGAIPQRFSRVYVPDVVDFVNEFVENLPDEPENDLPDLPDIEPELLELPPNWRNVQELVDQIRGFLNEYGNEPNQFGQEDLSEDESITHFVVPLLRALGWPILNIAVQWRRIDVSVFDELPRTPENCRLVIEVKQLYSGIEGGALNQARGYAFNNEIMGDDRYIVVTDGIRYRLFLANDADDPTQIAYANLEHLRESHLRLFEGIKRP